MRVIYLIIAAVQLPIHTIGTLTHTMLFPHVVEVSSETSSVNNITDETIRLSFGTRKFSCSDPTDESEFVDESLDSIPLLEKIVSLDGMCWTVPTDETSRRFYRVCIGKDIHLLDVRDSSRKRSQATLLAPIRYASPSLSLVGLKKYMRVPMRYTEYSIYVTGTSGFKVQRFAW